MHKATRPNLNESFFISHDRGADHPDVLAGLPLRGRNQWPDGHDGMRTAMMRYFTTLEAVGERMLPVLARALDMPADAFAPFFADEAHVNLRFLHYPPQDTDDDEQFGQGPHTDNSFITILAREDVPGLAVRLPSGEWLAPPVIEGTFLVNLGNMMKRWSNDRFLSTPHGVLNDTGRDRYSIAFFYSPNVQSVIECLPSCVGPDNPPRYEPAVYRDLVLAFYNANYFHRSGYEQGRGARLSLTRRAVRPDTPEIRGSRPRHRRSVGSAHQAAPGGRGQFQLSLTRREASSSGAIALVPPLSPPVGEHAPREPAGPGGPPIPRGIARRGPVQILARSR